ncbi:ATP-binding cassette domain-containing protein [Klebsiella michiganensis]|uniref:methionine ABC transporter ATP-binding protein n=1 Tax=Klebsiella michiganensis TaxID=1134687 RepID=UPI001ADF4CDF|nr:ATP-binding cassette domain-containing protein [Klebsiella michiganensis]ELS0725402.1 ATP-binding cassette domain-containing protein [Klebsiella michiganensis]QTN52729.1 ATP-binding cassette domain-containing protein [Klebsiella michiganensis]
MIEIVGLSKTYAGTGRPALNDVSLQVPRGAVYGILGRSGAGKSTLIRCLNLLERPTSGRIIVNGNDITRMDKTALREYRLRTGMIFQHFNLLHARSVADNVAVPLEIAKVPKAARQARVAELLELVGLADINQKLNLTIVLITHELEVVKTLCDHAALLEHGEIIESGRIADLLVAPWSRLRQSLLHDPQAERDFLARHGFHGRPLCGVA